MTAQTHTIILSQRSTVPMSILLPMYRTLGRQLGDSTGCDVALYITITTEEKNVVIDMLYNPVRGFVKEELTIK